MNFCLRPDCQRSRQARAGGGKGGANGGFCGFAPRPPRSPRRTPAPRHGAGDGGRHDVSDARGRWRVRAEGLRSGGDRTVGGTPALVCGRSAAKPLADAWSIAQLAWPFFLVGLMSSIWVRM